jgi:hypothetical protein
MLHAPHRQSQRLTPVTSEGQREAEVRPRDYDGTTRIKDRRRRPIMPDDLQFYMTHKGRTMKQQKVFLDLPHTICVDTRNNNNGIKYQMRR